MVFKILFPTFSLQKMWAAVNLSQDNCYYIDDPHEGNSYDSNYHKPIRLT